MNPETHIYKVSELTRGIKDILDHNLSELWIEGEVSNLSTSPRGHTYLTLKDAASQIKAVIFKSQRLLPSSIPLKNGQLILAFGKISVYERSGNYQIIISRWEPQGLGALQLAFEKLKKRLYQEGLFDDRHKKPLPLFPRLIGVITSPTGAAIRDIIKTLDRRFPDFNLLLYPVRVQGREAPGEIARAIDFMNQLPDVNVLIVGRGGGSLEDLWAFNEEIVARSIFNSRIPIISSVGHEIDYTIADFTADRRAATPSIAAEIVIPQKDALLEKIEFLKHSLHNTIRSYLNDLSSHIVNLRGSYVFKKPENTLLQYTQRVDELHHRITVTIRHLLATNKQLLNTFKTHLYSLNPVAILKRGYSITTDAKNGKIVTESKQLRKQDEVVTRVAKGSFRSIVRTKTD